MHHFESVYYIFERSLRYLLVLDHHQASNFHIYMQYVDRYHSALDILRQRYLYDKPHVVSYARCTFEHGLCPKIRHY